MSKLEKYLDDLTQVEALLEKMELTTSAETKKAEGLLNKMASFASRDKYLSGNFNYFSGVISYLKKDYKAALNFFSKSIECSATAGTSHGFDHLWKAYTHLALNEINSVYKELSLGYKKNKKIVAKLKWMKGFESLKGNPEYKKAIGIKDNPASVDPIIQKWTDYILENSDLNYLQFLKMINKDKEKVKDKVSLCDAQIWVAELLLDDALEHELGEQDLYDEGPYTLKQLKTLLKSSKEERKKFGRTASYFHQVTKNEAA